MKTVESVENYRKNWFWPFKAVSEFLDEPNDIIKMPIMLNKNMILMLVLVFPICLFAQQERARDNAAVSVFEQYQENFLSQDVEQIMQLYARDAVMIIPNGNSLKGPEEIRTSYERAFDYFPESIRFQTLNYGAAEGLVFHVYSMWDEDAGEKIIPFASETLVIEEGKIKYHTISEFYPNSVQAPVSLSLPVNWTSQVSALPRYFAPDLYEGIADYAFAPGMFEPKEEDYFTYAMVLWTPLDTEVNKQQLEKDLETYFDGLAAVAVPGIDSNNAVSKISHFFDSLSTKLSVPEDRLRANVELSASNIENNEWETVYNGSIRMYEGMVGHQPVKLQAKLRLAKCPAAGYRVIFFEASPQPYSNKLWDQLDTMADQWRCPEE